MYFNESYNFDWMIRGINDVNLNISHVVVMDNTWAAKFCPDIKDLPYEEKLELMNLPSMFYRDEGWDTIAVNSIMLTRNNSRTGGNSRKWNCLKDEGGGVTENTLSGLGLPISGIVCLGGLKMKKKKC